jgi:dipeptidyl aminopeptidase/acylaminoacyl peptidase
MTLATFAKVLAGALLLPVSLGLPACAQGAPQTSNASAAHIEEILLSLEGGHAIGQVAISPDGKHLAWNEDGQIRLAPYGALDQSRRVTAANSPDQPCREGSITWSPDSAWLAFFSDCANPGKQSDLYLAPVSGGPARRLTTLNGYVNAPAFSPDGSQIAFLYVEGATRPAGALAAEPLPSGVIGEDHIEIQRVARVTVPSPSNCEPSATPDERPQAAQTSCLNGLFSFLTPPNLHVFEFDWSPDAKSLAYVAADPPGENNWWVAKLYTQAMGETPRAILAPADIPGPLHGLQIAVPRWSPDGRFIAYIGGLMSDQGVTGGDVWAIAATGGAARDLTPGRPASAAWIEWGDEEHIFAEEIAGGDMRLVRYALHGHPASEGETTSFGAPIFDIPGVASDGSQWMSLSSTSDRSVFVFRSSTFDRPAEIYAAAARAAKASTKVSGFEGVEQLTHINDGIVSAWGKTVSIAWASGPFHVQGWLILPGNFDPARKYPLIVQVHGGPASAVIPHWGVGSPLSVEAFSALGYFVFMPNPRGSYGQGEAFTQANRKDFGYGDLRDILAGVDAVEAKYPIDPNRVGLDGWSYGGFMTMFAVTQTHRFKAAVAGAGISDWLSYYGENSIDQWMIPYFGASVYDDPAVYAKSSAIHFIKQVHTPTLIVVGDRDGECPAPQSFEFWHALRDLHVPTELVVYPNEGHGFVNPEHQRDVLERAAEWFARNMPPGP